MIQGEDGNDSFDFNQIVPMPDDIKNTESSSTVMDGLNIFGYEVSFIDKIPKFVGKYNALSPMLKCSWIRNDGITTIEGVEKKLLERNPNAIEKGKKALEAFNKYGHISWYGWSIENWGTKWNSYGFCMNDQKDDRVEFEFDTAWSFPEPIFTALSKEFPLLKFDVASFDEGHNFCLSGVYMDAFDVIDYYKSEDCDPLDDDVVAKIYERVYGERYVLDEDDE
jgi:hypothetical protein